MKLLIALLVLCVLIFIHELGHFCAARLAGVRVNQFSLGLPPKAFGRKWGDTEYLVSWIPFGGYVKLEGQSPEEENPDDPQNFAAKKPYQKAYIMAAGSLFNLLLALLIMPIIYWVGVERPAWRLSEPVVAEVLVGSFAETDGFKAGDQILQVEEIGTGTWEEFFDALGSFQGKEMVVVQVGRQDGLRHRVLVPMQHFKAKDGFGIEPFNEPVVGRVLSGTPAEMGGLKEGDMILALNGKETPTWNSISHRVQTEAGTKPVEFLVERNGQKLSLRVAPKLIPEINRWQVGIQPPVTLEAYGFGEAAVRGTQDLLMITGKTFQFLGRLVSGQASLSEVSGPVGIFTSIGDAAESSIATLIVYVAFISLQLGIINLLPIPPLDGGHILVLAVEKIKGSKLREDVKLVMQYGGTLLLVLLIILVTLREVVQFFH